MMLPPFQQLVDEHWRDVARLCAALAAPGEGEDAAQRAWLRALDAYPSLTHARNLRGWLLTIAARAAVDTHRPRAVGVDRGARGDRQQPPAQVARVRE